MIMIIATVFFIVIGLHKFGQPLCRDATIESLRYCILKKKSGLWTYTGNISIDEEIAKGLGAKTVLYDFFSLFIMISQYIYMFFALEITFYPTIIVFSSLVIRYLYSKYKEHKCGEIQYLIELYFELSDNKYIPKVVWANIIHLVYFGYVLYLLVFI